VERFSSKTFLRSEDGQRITPLPTITPSPLRKKSSALWKASHKADDLPTDSKG
jgi:hypothetical protein